MERYGAHGRWSDGRRTDAQGFASKPSHASVIVVTLGAPMRSLFWLGEPCGRLLGQLPLPPIWRGVVRVEADAVADADAEL